MMLEVMMCFRLMKNVSYSIAEQIFGFNMTITFITYYIRLKAPLLAVAIKYLTTQSFFYKTCYIYVLHLIKLGLGLHLYLVRLHSKPKDT